MPMTRRPFWTVWGAVGCVVLAAASVGTVRRPQTSPGPSEQYERRDVMIATRDGVKLNTMILTPKAATGPLPFLLLRTPYGIDGAQARLDTAYRELAEEGYIFVFQDIRGRYRSEGRFVMMRPPRDQGDRLAVDESTDTFDTIDWLLANVPNHNGRVGATGVSYGGWLTVMAMLDPHPALKAVSPQASPVILIVT